MGNLLVYSLQTSLMMVALYSVYKLALKDSTQHHQSRAILLSIVTLSLLCTPIMALWQHLQVNQPNSAAVLGQLSVGDVVSDTSSTGVNFMLIAICIYGLGVVALLINTLCNIVKMLILVARGRRSAQDERVVIISENKYGSFSWFGFIVISEEDYRDNYDMILCHETRHLQLHHWVDLLYVQLVKCLTWYNPVIYLLARDLQVVHEYQADSAVLSEGYDAKTYQLLLLNKVVRTSVPAVMNGINNSQLKLRIIMMLKSKQSAGHRVIAAILAPIAIAASVIVLNQTVVASELKKISAVDMYVNNAESKLVEPADISGVSNSVVDETPAIEQSGTPAATSNARLPQFVGGETAMMNWLCENIRYPENAPADNKKHVVLVSFAVATTGEITDAQIMKSESIEALDQEAIRVISAMPKWEPGVNEKGEAVSVTYTLPITFFAKTEE